MCGAAGRRSARAALLVTAAVALAAHPAASLAQEATAPAGGARVHVRGPGGDAVERAIADVLASHGYKLARGRRKAGALRVDGKVRGAAGPAGARGRTTIALSVRRGRGPVLAQLRVKAASRAAALKRVESELWPKIAPALARGGAPPADAPEVAAAGPDPEPDLADPPAKKLEVPALAPAAASPAAAAARPERRRTSAADRSRAASAGADSGAAGADRDEPAGASATELSASAPSARPAPGQSWLSIAVGPELYARHFSYRDDLFQKLREYDLAATPAVGVAAEVYPMAMSSRGPLAGLGLAGRFTHVPNFDSEDTAGSQYSGEARSYAVGGRYRHRIAAVDLAGALDYGSQSFAIAPKGDAMDPDFPAVRYHYLRAGLGAAAPLFSRFALSAAVGYRQVLSSGEIESADFFPRSSVRGFDAELGLSAAIGWGFDVRAGAALERYGYALHPEPGDAKVAGGALDQYMRFSLQLGYRR